MTAVLNEEDYLGGSIRDGIYTLVVTDAYGSTNTYANITVDTTAPTNVTVSYTTNPIRSIANFVSFGLFFKDYVDVNITAQDGTSGVSKYEYKLVNANGSLNRGWTQAPGGNIRLTPDFGRKVCGRAIDKAGNVSDGVCDDSSTHIVINASQANAPTITTNGYLTGWTKDDVVITLSGSSVLAGISSYQYKTEGSASWTEMPGTSSAIGQDRDHPLQDMLNISTDTNTAYSFRAV